MGAAPAPLGEEGALHRPVPQGARRAAAVLRASAHRAHAAPSALLAGRKRRERPDRDRRRRGGRLMRSTPELDARAGLDKLATYPFAVLTWVDDAGYPLSVAIEPTFESDRPAASFTAPAGLPAPTDRGISLPRSRGPAPPRDGAA